ncbi:MAG: FHIPEP family type III secretion protein [Candidatus Lokiarchaeota archaeon]|nr:FHIPEP family type III secretion protein [Candidatus Lokiarchaeota archaeon]
MSEEKTNLDKIPSEREIKSSPPTEQQKSDSILIEVKLDSSLKNFATLGKEEHQEFHQKLHLFIEGIVRDLALPFEISLDVTVADEKIEMLGVPYITYVNHKRVIYRLDEPHEKITEGNELAIKISKGILENRQILLTESLSALILESWSSLHGDILKQYSKSQFHEALESCIRHGISINRYIEEISKYDDVENPIPLFYHENAFSMDNINIEILLNDEMYRKYEEEEEKREQATSNKHPVTKIDTFNDGIAMTLEGLFYELGLFLPKPEISLDYRLREWECRFKINDLRFLPLKMMGENEYLVNDTVDRLKLIGVQGRKAFNPANYSEQAIITESESVGFCERAGLVTWNTTQYLFLALSALIRGNACMFLSIETTNILLNKLKQQYPFLIKAVEQQYSMAELTCILRSFLEEELSIRNLPALLEKIIELRNIKEFYSSNPNIYISEIVKELRISQQLFISWTYGRGMDRKSLVCYLLNDKLEKAINETAVIDENMRLKLLKAFINKIGDPINAVKATIITNGDIRHKVRTLIASLLPKLPVIAYEEIGSDMNIQPVDRFDF